MRDLYQTSQFKRDVKRMKKRGRDPASLKKTVELLVHDKPLPPSHRDHPLIGPWQGSRDCHIAPDWILIYTLTSHGLILERTGPHADLF